jgi:hypothetical protein
MATKEVTRKHDAPLIIDGCANLLSRQFERDMLSVLRRSKESSISGTVLTCVDFSRADEIVALAKEVLGCVGFKTIALFEWLARL